TARYPLSCDIYRQLRVLHSFPTRRSSDLVSNQANVFLTGFSGSSKPSWLSIFFDHAPAETIKESALNVWLSVSTLTISLWTDTFSTLLCVKIVAPCCTASFR